MPKIEADQMATEPDQVASDPRRMTSENQATQGSRETAKPVRAIALETVERGGLIILLLVMIVIFSVDSTSGGSFRGSANIQQLLANQGVTGIIALAMVVPLVSGYFDLSVAAIPGLANVAVAALLGTHHDSVVIVIIVTLLISALAGAINGFLVARLRLNGFVVTLGTYTLIGGLLLEYTKGTTLSNGIPTSFGAWASADYLGVPRPFWVLIVISILCWYVLMHTPFGRKLEAIGSNESAARLVGINVDRAIFISFLVSALLAGAAGILLTSTSGDADPTAGPAYLFPALAAVFIGATSIRPGRYNVWGTIIGVFVVAVAIDGFTLLGASSWVTPVFNGGALVGAVTISTLIGRKREASARTMIVHRADDAPSGSNGGRSREVE
jgi:ribose transport system permease protein